MRISISKGFISIKWKTRKEKKLRKIFKQYSNDDMISAEDIGKIATKHNLWVAANPYDKWHDINYLVMVTEFQ